MLEQAWNSFQQALDAASPWIFSAALLLIVVGLLMRLPLEKELSWFWRLSRIRKFITMFAVVSFAYTVVPKGDGGNGGPMRSPRMMMQRQLASAPESSSAYYGMFPAWTNVVTNVCATGFLPVDTSVVVRVHQPAGLYPVPTGIEVYASPTLSPVAWSKIGTAPIVGGTDGTIIEFPCLFLPDGWTNSMFFAFGLTDDLDGDEIPDREELGVTEPSPYNSSCWSGISNQCAIWPSSTVADAGSVAITLPYSCTINGVTYSKARVIMDGTIYLLDPAHENTYGVPSFDWPPSLTEGNLCGWRAVAIVAFGDNLALDGPRYNSQTWYGECELPSGPASVIEFYNACFYSERRSDSPHLVSFQIVLPHNEPNVVYLNYPSMCPESYYVSRGVTIGVQCPYLEPIHDVDWYYNLVWTPTSAFFGARQTLKVTIGHGTDPACFDSDGDGFSDGAEVKLFGTDPTVADDDSDSDRLPDVVEIRIGTDPEDVDTDNDGLDDSYEYAAGLDPCHPDTDRDGLPDGWEVEYDLDPGRATGDNGTHGDPDHDGLSNIDEYQNGCNPRVPDTDRDGVSDGVEVGQGSDPTEVSDGGEAPSADLFRELTFNIGGDWAAWELTVAGLGPYDTRIRKISMGAPDAPNTTTLGMRKGNSYRLSMRWLNCDGHTDRQAPWYCWQTQIDGLPTAKTYDDYSNLRMSGSEIVVGSGWIAENSDGLLTEHIHESTAKLDGSSGGGNVAEGLEATLYVLGDPRLVFDYDRDGKIDDADVATAKEGKTFRFWINDDNDSGDTNESENDRPESGPNHLNGHVDGRCDLLDFTPVWIDTTEVFPSGTPSSISNDVIWKVRSSCVNAVWTWLSRGEAGEFQHEGASCGYGSGHNYSPEGADVVSLASGMNLPSVFEQTIRWDSDNGVFLIEGCAEGTNLVVEGWSSSSSKVVVSNCANICITPVESMYWFHSLYGAESDNSFTPPRIAAPTNLWDVAICDKDVFFTHGFRVNEQDAHAWGAEVFKRFWQSGSNARFHMFTWAGAYGWPDSGLYYPKNAYQAQMSGGALKRLIEREQADSSKRILMTQSLGNMVACEALREGLQVAQYYMFDAALPSESIDETLRVESSDDAGFSKYVRPDWHDYTNACWASNWYRFFENDPSDARGKMKWPGRFTDALANATEVFNYYSSGDSVFHETEDPPWLLEGMDESNDNYCWQKQETLKGVKIVAGTAYGGWGFHRWRIAGFDYQYTSIEAANMVVDGSITNNPVFDHGYAPMLSGGASEQEVFTALAKYIPALSSPVGGNKVLDSTDYFDFDMNQERFVPRPNGWGRPAVKNQTPWLHSDMKDMAFFYVYKLYEQLIQKGNLK